VSIVSLRALHKRYGDCVILDGFDLEVGAGQVVALLGLSGAGKTTALKTINRLVEPDSGGVQVLGREARDWEPVALRRRVGWVIQDAGLLPHMSALDNAGLVLRLLGWPSARRQARARELLTLVGLSPDRHGALLPRQLSGGERQRVGLARALACEPPLLLMDEPFGALDPLTRRRLQDEFRALQRRLGTSVVLVTHDLPEALRLGDQVVVMDRGRVAQLGVPDEIRSAPSPGFVAELVAAALGNGS
jgi:osmoprotectant transport system ATP-binding protein